MIKFTRGWTVTCSVILLGTLLWLGSWQERAPSTLPKSREHVGQEVLMHATGAQGSLEESGPYEEYSLAPLPPSGSLPFDGQREEAGLETVMTGPLPPPPENWEDWVADFERKYTQVALEELHQLERAIAGEIEVEVERAALALLAKGEFETIPFRYDEHGIRLAWTEETGISPCLPPARAFVRVFESPEKARWQRTELHPALCGELYAKERERLWLALVSTQVSESRAHALEYARAALGIGRESPTAGTTSAESTTEEGPGEGD